MYTIFGNILDKHIYDLKFDIFYTVIYVTLINLTENGIVFFYCDLRAIFFLCLWVLKSFNFGQIKINILWLKTIKYLLFRNVFKCKCVYRYSFLIRTDNF